MSSLMQQNFISGPVILKETNQLVGIVSYKYDGLSEICILISAHRDFIDHPKVSI